MIFFDAPKFLLRTLVVALIAVFAVCASVSDVQAKIVIEKNAGLGTIKGFVRDEAGNAIADAYVSFFRNGNILKKVRSAANGSFLAKVLPGTYTVLAVAEGFNSITLPDVEINRSSELVYRFNLERAGNGNTLPEKKIDRNSTKWRIRGTRSSIYQNQEGDEPIGENKTNNETVAVNEPENSVVDTDAEEISKRKSQTVVEGFTANSGGENFTGVNVATLLPITENSEVILAGQTTTSQNAPQRFEARLNFRPNENHQLRVGTSVAKLGTVEVNKNRKTLGQFSVQATDEWRVKNGVVFVFGIDYSRFLGAGNDYSFSPRFGFQYDINSKTRFRTAYTTQTEEKTWSRAIELEDSTVMFREPVSTQEFVVENGKAQMNKSSRLEFGVERVLDNSSTIEANVFFDLTSGRGVGLLSVPIDFLSNDGEEFVGNQQGKAQGIRVVYSRRLSGMFSTSAGYAFGNGQKLSEEAISDPASVFENDYFQTFFGQFNADLRSGTQIKAVFRLSSQATVFAIDPFQGRMMIYDPGLSVVVTQSLPTLGLPIRAEAIIDARNLLDFQTGVNGEDGSLKLNSQRRVLRGGIMVRF